MNDQKQLVSCPECGTGNSETMTYDRGGDSVTSTVACGCGWGQRLEFARGDVISYRQGCNGVDGIGCLGCGWEIEDYGTACERCVPWLHDDDGGSWRL